MRWAALALVALIAVHTVVAETDAEELDKKPKKGKGKKHLKRVGSRCDNGWMEVANSLCCPKDHPQLIDTSCYAECPDGSDDMVLGAWVGCRDMCPGGYSSSINECNNGILTSQRADHSRTGVDAKAQASVDSMPEPEVSTCHKDYVAVALSGNGRHKHGGCCPSHHPRLIRDRCYAGCESGRDEITIGDFVGCRAHCPDGWTEHNNDCTKDRDVQDRGDFPRDSYEPHDRIIRPKEATDNNKGCGSGFVGASKRYCCPSTHPILIDLLCYKRCKTGFVEARYGCRKECPAKSGWSSTPLRCHHTSGRSFHRKGYERHPKPSQLRSLSSH